jgi:hypothetical protein
MAVKPIPFSGPMVRAILDGKKSQTRRVLKPQPSCDAIEPHRVHSNEFIPWRDGEALASIVAPYAAGDMLWVREAWRCLDGLDQLSGGEIAERCTDAGYHRPWAPIRYEADGECTNWIREPHGFGTEAGRYRHGRFMPRWASRLTLRVTDVRVQRLWEISEADAKAEGVSSPPEGDHPEWSTYDSYTDVFAELWDSLNAKRGLGWNANPWVAAYTFDVIRQNVDQIEEGK